MKPSVGRIVHYHAGGYVLAAIVCYVHNDQVVNLAVFSLDGESVRRPSVKYSETGELGTWSWPPRV